MSPHSGQVCQDIPDAEERRMPVWGWRAIWSTRCCWRGEAPGRSPRAHGISKTWIYELIKRYRAGGYEALEPRSKRPGSCPRESSAQTVAAVVQMRAELPPATARWGAALQS
jgi:hypothetical protein